MLETLETINYRLKRDYGYFEHTYNQLWRVVDSHDIFEKRLITHSDEGFELASPVVVEVPKYRQWADYFCILERALPVPEFVDTDLLDKWSYEPVWIFKDKNNNPLPPRWDVCQIVIDQVYKNAAGTVGAKYKDPLAEFSDPKIAKEAKQARLDELKEALFGNETDTTDALAYKSGVVVPHGQTTQTKENE